MEWAFLNYLLLTLVKAKAMKIFFTTVYFLSIFFCGAQPLKINLKDFPIQKKDVFVRTQPIYMLTHATFVLEAEYIIKDNAGISVDYFYSVDMFSNQLICFSCYLIDFAETRHMVSLNYKFYLAGFNKTGLGIAPYLRYRNWQGLERHFLVMNDWTSQPERTISSNGILAGATFFVVGNSKVFSALFYMGGGLLLYDSYKNPLYTKYQKEGEIRIGLNLGLRIPSAKKAKNDL